MVPSTAEMEPALVRPMAPHGATRSALPEIPPLPRPRPAALASRKPLDDGNPGDVSLDRQAAGQFRGDLCAAGTSAAPTAPAASAAPKKSPATVEPLND